MLKYTDFKADKSAIINYKDVISLESLKKALLTVTTDSTRLSKSYQRTFFSLKELIQLHNLLKKQKYFPISNQGNPNPKDLIVLTALKQRLEPLLEPTISPSSFGFRPFLHSATGIRFLKKHIPRTTWVLKVNFFELMQEKQIILLKKKLRKISDQNSFNLIQKFLITNYIDLKTDYSNIEFFTVSNRYSNSAKAILSPLLIHYFFKDFDLFLANLRRLEHGKPKPLNKPKLNKNLTLWIQTKLNIKEKKQTETGSFYFLRFVNCLWVGWYQTFFTSNLTLLKVKQFLKNEYEILSIPKLISWNKTQVYNVRFMGLCWKQNKDFNLELIPDLESINSYLEKKGIATRNPLTNQIKPKGIYELSKASDSEIIEFFSKIIKGFYNFFNDLIRLKDLLPIMLICKKSCAITLAIKYKLKNRNQVYKKFSKQIMALDEKTTRKTKLFFPFVTKISS